MTFNAAGGSAYGLRLTGPVLAPVSHLLQAGDGCSKSWPLVTIDFREAPVGLRPTSMDADRVCRPFRYGGSYVVDRARMRATFEHAGTLDAQSIVHPGLAGVGAAFAGWLGRSIFHAGAFVVGGGAWAVLGEKGEGKTTLLAALHGAGHAVVCDDLLVTSGSIAFAGPRTLDLRPDAAAMLGSSVETLEVRQGERHRLVLGPVQHEVPLRGWIVLTAGAAVSLTTVPPADRLIALAPHAGGQMAAPDPRRLLALTALPMLRLERPKRTTTLAECIRALAAVVGSALPQRLSG